MTEPRFHEQLQRVKRYYQKMKETQEGKLHNRDSEFSKDEVYSFFQNCYHLKDWIKNDQRVHEKAKRQVECYITLNDSLSLCAGICNSTKHLKLNRKPRSDLNPTLTKTIHKMSLGPKEQHYTAAYIIELNNGNEIDAFKLATECLKAWGEFFEKYNLLVQTNS